MNHHETDSRNDSDSPVQTLAESSLVENSFMDYDYGILGEEITNNSDIEKPLAERKVDMEGLQKIEKNREKNYFLRNLRLMDRGSIRASIFTLFSGSVGAGVLSLPHVREKFLSGF
jgi:hypothetical protein